MARRRKKERGRQLNRILRLMRRLEHAKSGMSLDELCKDLKVSRRTLYRDIRALEEAGFRLESEGDLGEEKKWRFTDGQRRSMSSTFTETELLSLYFCLNLTDPLKGTPIHAGIEALVDKVESAFSAKDRDHYSNVIFTHLARPWSTRDFRRHAAAMSTISRGVLDDKKVEVSYRASGVKGPKTYLFHPYCLAYFKGEFYVIGYSEHREEIRTLRVDRIHRAVETEKKFERPEEFDAQDYLERGFTMYAEGDPTDVRLEFTDFAAKVMKDRVFHPSQEIKEKAGGKIEMRLKVQGLSEVARLVMEHAPNAKVIEPKELAKMVRGWADKLVATHK